MTVARARRAAARDLRSLCRRGKNGGARRPRTDDLKLAKLALSQLSYGPNLSTKLAGVSPLQAKSGGPGKI
jgi:hypothetical protein